MATPQQQLAYIERFLVYDIYKYFGKDADLVSHSVENSQGLDGFMSALYTVQLELKLGAEGRLQRETVLVKLMKGTPEFRESSKSYTQFANEVFAYAELLPAFEHLLRSSHLNPELVQGWIPRVYAAKFGLIESLSKDRESVLALKDLKRDGFELGPRLILRRDHLEAMCALIGPYHALGYATHILQPQVYERLRSGVVNLPFVTPPGAPAGVFDVLYRIAFDRFFEYYDRQKERLTTDEGFRTALERLRAKYFAQPVELLERIRTSCFNDDQPDSYFCTFVHGDFNRNNVLFHYGPDGAVDSIKMIDFQELRYSTTAIDLSFFMYINTSSAERENIFPELLRHYHRHMYDMLELVLQRNKDSFTEEELQQHLNNYSYERFYAHFKRYAFYGVLICMHFMPWLLAGEEDCAKLSHLFESDMHGPGFYQLSLDIAGDAANQEIFKTVCHAYEQGYMDEL